MSQFKCNLCLRSLHLFTESTPQEPKSYLSECMRHIFCELCVNKLKPYCACKRKTRFLEIREQMPTKFRMMFESPRNILKQLYSAHKFQMDHYRWNSKQLVKRIITYKQEQRKTDTKRDHFVAGIRLCKENNEKLTLMIRQGMKYRKRPSPKIPPLQQFADKKFGFRPNLHKHAHSISPRHLHFTVAQKTHFNTNYDLKANERELDSGLGLGQSNQR